MSIIVSVLSVMVFSANRLDEPKLVEAHAVVWNHPVFDSPAGIGTSRVNRMCHVIVRNITSDVIELPRLVESYNQRVGKSFHHFDGGTPSYPAAFVKIAPGGVHVLPFWLDNSNAPDEQSLNFPIDVYCRKQRYRCEITLPLPTPAKAREWAGTVRIQEERKKGISPVIIDARRKEEVTRQIQDE